MTPPNLRAALVAALVASCLLGALPPVDLRAVCFVRAIFAERWVVAERSRGLCSDRAARKSDTP